MMKNRFCKATGRSARVVFGIVVVILLSATGDRGWSAEPEREVGKKATVAALQGPLVTYLKNDDRHFRWKVRAEHKVGDTEVAELTMTSQQWQGITWKHQLFLIRPKSATADTRQALLFVTGGSWRDELQREAGTKTSLPRESALFAGLAERLKTPVAVLLHVPFQPIFDGKKEDQIIAYTFKQFLETGDGNWPLLLPMVKSAVRGMDAMQEFAQQRWQMKIDKFTVSGASKRGWTTWLTAAADPRVQAIAPMVIDMLNMSVQMKHQKVAWGDYSYKIGDYTELGLEKTLDTDRGKQLQAIVDPFSYRKRLTQPKLIMLGTNDHYWPLDALNLYWDQLEGPKYILYVPNNRHGLKDLGRVTGSLTALHRSLSSGTPLPQLQWKFSRGDGQLKLDVSSDKQPQSVLLWTASAKTRDFRQAKWTANLVAPGDKSRYRATLAQPTSGFAACFAEARYPGQLPFFLSTQLQIIQASAE